MTCTQAISILLFRLIHSDTGYHFMRAISSIIRLSRNFALVALCWGKRYWRRKGTRESKNVGFHTTSWPAACERERRSKARDRHARKLVSFVKFLERKVPLGSPILRHLSRARVSRICSALPCPYGSELVSNGPGVYNEGITRAHLTLLRTPCPLIRPIVIISTNCL